MPNPIRVFVLALSLALPMATGAAERLKALDLFEIEYPTDPQISPDGTRVVYRRQFADIQSDRMYANLWIVNVDGSGHRPLTTGRFTDSSPRWSPDGSRLVFVSDRDGTTQLQLLYLDSRQIAPLTHLSFAPSSPAWSPDGKQIAFLSLVEEKPPVLATLPAAPKDAKWADPPQVIDRLQYRFNGPGYLPHGYRHLFVVSAEGGTARQVTSGRFNDGGSFGDAGVPAWAPDGKALIFSANRHDDWEYDVLNSEVYEAALADGLIRALTARNGPDNEPAVAPDGKQIAYTGYDDRRQGYQVTRLYVMNRDGSGARALSAEFDRDVRQPAWTADGRRLVFVYDDEGISKIGTAALDGKVETLAEGLGTNGSSYSAGVSFSLAKDGALAFPVTRQDLPGDIAWIGAGGTGRKPRALTAINADLLDARQLGTLEEVRYESSLDQRKLEGWLLRPPGYDPAKKYPLILEIHGGPFANYGPRFDIEKQLWAARDYVVFYANPRGSTSYGQEFGNLIHHAYPGDDFYDLNSGVDAVIARGGIDPENVFVTGGSGGGVLTCWLIGRTERFRAAASAYPVINWISWTLTADIASFGMNYWFPGPPWDFTEHYMKRSLLSVVKNVKTPTLVITGEEDYRTPMSESEQYYTALKLLKVEAALVRVPGEPHGIRRRPSHHLAKIYDILEWFEKHRSKPANAKVEPVAS